MTKKLLIIDPQMDFMDTPSEIGALAVMGADQDMNRLANLIQNLGADLSEIYVTLDSHHAMDIAHPGWWVDKEGNAPQPFTQIKYDDVKAGLWHSKNPEHQKRSEEYLKELSTSSRKNHTIWPEHCLIGTAGHRIHPKLMEALLAWEHLTLKQPVFVAKGENPFTEHFSGFKASVPDPLDEGTQMNKKFADQLMKDANVVMIAGEALSHCVADTTRDLADYIGPDAIKKLVLIQDACSPVTGFEKDAEAFVDQMKERGMSVQTVAQLQPCRRGMPIKM